MLKKILIAFLVLFLLFVIGGFVLPSEFAVACEVEIDANSEKVHEVVGDLRRWKEWGPWHDTDPTIKVTYGDKVTGVGAHQSWTGEDGPGELTLTRSDPKTGVAYDMVLNKMPSSASIDYEVMGDKTKVVWKMDGDLDIPVIGPYFAMLIPSAIGGMFDNGLQKIKTIVEAPK